MHIHCTEFKRLYEENVSSFFPGLPSLEETAVSRLVHLNRGHSAHVKAIMPHV